MTDTRVDHGYTCYCESCLDTADDWFYWGQSRRSVCR